MSEMCRIVIATPVYNDWGSLAKLLQEIDRLINRDMYDLNIVVIDDGSIQPNCLIKEQIESLKNITQIEILHLARNLGHQKAIAIGLAYINDNLPCDLVLVMDSDGEDRPSDILRLIDFQRKTPGRIIFAQRSMRSEGTLFRIFYSLYKLVFRLLTGKGISFGNFCAIPRTNLSSAVHLPEIWNHFPAGIMRAGLPRGTLSTTRGKRFAGKSKMNFISLIIHGLSAISVYIEIVTVRLIVFSLVVILLGIIGFMILVYIKYLTPLAIPGWATSVAIGITVIVFQAFSFLAILSFIILNYRSLKLFIPAKDYKDYLGDKEKLLRND